MKGFQVNKNKRPWEAGACKSSGRLNGCSRDTGRDLNWRARRAEWTESTKIEMSWWSLSAFQSKRLKCKSSSAIGRPLLLADSFRLEGSGQRSWAKDDWLQYFAYSIQRNMLNFALSKERYRKSHGEVHRGRHIKLVILVINVQEFAV